MDDTSRVPTDKEPQISIRMTEELKARAEALRERMQRMPAYQGLTLKTATVLRLAIVRGLDALEAEAPPASHAPAKPARKR